MYYLFVLMTVLSSAGGGATSSVVVPYDNLKDCIAASKGFSHLDQTLASATSTSQYRVKVLCISGQGALAKQ